MVLLRQAAQRDHDSLEDHGYDDGRLHGCLARVHAGHVSDLVPAPPASPARAAPPAPLPARPALERPRSRPSRARPSTRPPLGAPYASPHRRSGPASPGLDARRPGHRSAVMSHRPNASTTRRTADRLSPPTSVSTRIRRSAAGAPRRRSPGWAPQSISADVTHDPCKLPRT